MLGPIIGGPIIEFRGFPSLGSIMAGMNISMVSPCLFFRLNCTILLFFMVCPSLGRLAELRGTKHYQRLSSWRFVCILFLIAPFPHVLFNCIQPRPFWASFFLLLFHRTLPSATMSFYLLRGHGRTNKVYLSSLQLSSLS